MYQVFGQNSKSYEEKIRHACVSFQIILTSYTDVCTAHQGSKNAIELEELLEIFDSILAVHSCQKQIPANADLYKYVS